jgi:hypothetical protein
MPIVIEKVTGVKTHLEEGYKTQQDLLAIMERLLNLQERKAQNYGEAWRSQGYTGNVARVLSKVGRLKNMLWRDNPIEDAAETVVDTLEDLCLIAMFAIINYKEKNRWGK